MAVDISQTTSWVVLVVGIGSLGVSGILWNVIRAYKERIKQLEADNIACTQRSSDHDKDIAELSGQVKVLKEVPLAGIQSSLDSINKSLKNMQKRREGDKQ